ncbi:MAG: GxxExxY protein [Tepidisphaeraceae bacterium]
MPYEEEDLRWGEPDPATDTLARLVIGAAIEVHRHLGAGLDESLYEAAMSRELSLRNIPFVRQWPVSVDYKGEPIGEKRLDFIVGARLVLELKAVTQLAPIHEAQVRTYLRITKLELGLLINFNVPLLKDGIKRIIHHN